MSVNFPNQQRVSGQLSGVNGTDVVTFPVDFQPNYMDLKFVGGNHSKGDTFAWGFSYNGVYWEVTITFTCLKPRDIKYVVSKLPTEADEF